MGYQVKLDTFEGPFDLLLSLISQQKLDIYEVPIAKIAEEYLAYLDKMREIDLDMSSEFVVIAATLLEIKSASLLSSEEELEEEEELTSYEAREILVAQLLQYKKFKNVALELAARQIAEGKFYLREAELEERFAKLLPDFLEEVSLEELAMVLNRVLVREPISIIDAEHITPAPVSLEGPIQVVLKKLESKSKLSFKKLTQNCRTRIEMILLFLALLELYKRGDISLGQPETFGEIEVSLVQGRRAS